VRIVDEVHEEIPEDGPFDLVGLGAQTATAPRAYAIAQRYRDQGIPVVMGGIHATALPDETARFVDVVFQGDAEGAWPQLIRDFEAGEAQTTLQWPGSNWRTCHCHGGTCIVMTTFGLISASRGCRYRCEFCSLWKLQTEGFRTRRRSRC
jgi:radical SAM superfamily enzyme YgiQ (UPF0313 family)